MKIYSKLLLSALATAFIGAVAIGTEASALQLPINDNPENQTHIKIIRRITGIRDEVEEATPMPNDTPENPDDGSGENDGSGDGSDEAPPAEPKTITNSYTYRVSGQASNLPDDFQISFNEAVPVNGVVQAEYDLDLSNITVPNTPGTYAISIKEIASDDLQQYPLSEEEYTFFVYVESIVDDEGAPTGNYTVITAHGVSASDGTKSEDAVFETEEPTPIPDVYSHFMLDVETSGKAAKDDDVFKFAIVIHCEDCEEITVKAPAGKYRYGNSEYENPTVAHANEVFYIYLKAGQLAIIGQNAAGEDELKVGTKYTIEQFDEHNYSGYIDDKDSGKRNKITKSVEEDPQNNRTHFINQKNPIDDYVDTGVIIRATPYMIMAIASAAVVALFAKIRKKKA